MCMSIRHFSISKKIKEQMYYQKSEEISVEFFEYIKKITIISFLFHVVLNY